MNRTGAISSFFLSLFVYIPFFKEGGAVWGILENEVEKEQEVWNWED